MYEYKCNITRVVDGDTVDAEIDCGFDIVFKSRIRLYGIDTPESRTRDLDEKARGKMAAKFLKDHIKKADLVKVKTKLDKKGKFGRVLGSIIADDVDLNHSFLTVIPHASSSAVLLDSRKASAFAVMRSAPQLHASHVSDFEM